MLSCSYNTSKKSPKTEPGNFWKVYQGKNYVDFSFCGDIQLKKCNVLHDLWSRQKIENYSRRLENVMLHGIIHGTHGHQKFHKYNPNIDPSLKLNTTLCLHVLKH
jgi:hypothetical protein